MGYETQDDYYVRRSLIPVFHSLVEIIRANSFYIAAIQHDTSTVIKAYNRDDVLFEEGDSSSLASSYCSRVTDDGEPFILTEGGSSVAAVPIVLRSGKRYGTLGAVDNHGYRFTESDIHLLQASAAAIAAIMDNQLLTERLDELKLELKTGGGLLSKISYDIRTPLNGIILMEELLKSTDLSEEQQKYVEVIQLSSKSLLELANEMLDYDKSGVND